MDDLLSSYATATTRGKALSRWMEVNWNIFVLWREDDAR
jgi:hypothetical protein